MAKKTIEIIVRCVCMQRGRVLLCRNRQLRHVFLPGGHVEFGEDARSALVRELREELGLKARIGDFLGACEVIFSQQGEKHHEINLVFAIKPLAAQTLARIKSREEHIEFLWASLADLRHRRPVGATKQRSLSLQVLPEGILQLLPGSENGSLFI